MSKKSKATCVSKKSFDSENLANGCIEFNGYVGSQTPYKCHNCDKWHIMTTDKNKRQTQTRRKSKKLYKKFKK